ncbi:MAG: hypothetical protein GOV00_00670 [Candidatus Altiarchaeota archaeon]|nr:hypothetical protein [Candidatus Altiarchaeota archaeon]
MVDVTGQQELYDFSNQEINVAGYRIKLVKKKKELELPSFQVRLNDFVVIVKEIKAPQWTPKSTLEEKPSWKHIEALLPSADPNMEMWFSPYYSFEDSGKTHRIRFWLVGPNVNCRFHNHVTDNPKFKELHYQLRGSGFMEIKGGRVEEMTKPGDTHTPFYTEKDGKLTYPVHRYVSGPKGSLFMVIEELV